MSFLDKLYSRMSEKKIIAFLLILFFATFCVMTIESMNYTKLKAWTVDSYGAFCEDKGQEWEGIGANASRYEIGCVNVDGSVDIYSFQKTRYIPSKNKGVQDHVFSLVE